MSEKKFDWADWIYRLGLTLANLSQVALMTWIAITAFRKGEDVWAAVAVALALLAASQFSDDAKGNS